MDGKTETSQTAKPKVELSAEEKRERLRRLLERQAEEASRTFPLSHGQQALWFLYQIAPDSSAYHCVALTKTTAVDPDAFAQALQHLTDRHAVLRTTYTTEDGIPVQTVQEPHVAQLQRIDAADWTQDQIDQKVEELRVQPFDLEAGPVYRLCLFSLPDGTFQTLFVIHHIAYDGVSSQVLPADLAQLYEAVRAESPLPPPVTERQYRDFVEWQHKLVEGAEGERQLEFWRQQIGHEPPVLELPTDRPRAATQSYSGDAVSLNFSVDLARDLRTLARQENVTLFVILLAGFQSMLHRYSGQQQVLVGTVTSGRTSREFESVLGYFVNPVALRADFDEELSFRQLIHQVRKTVVEGIAHQDYPFPVLVEKLHPKRDTSRNPVFQAMIDYVSRERVSTGEAAGSPQESTDANEEMRLRVDLGDLAGESVELPQQEGQVDVQLDVRVIGEKIYGNFKFDSDLFDRESATRMEESLRTLLAGAAAEPDHPITKLPVLGDSQRELLVGEWNQTEAEFPKMSPSRL